MTPLLILALLAAGGGGGTEQGSPLETQALVAEAEGRPQEALMLYLQALQSLPDTAAASLEAEDRLCTSAVRLASSPGLALAVPEAAQRHVTRGLILFKEARDAAGLGRSADEFHHSVRLAPWFGPALYNLALVQERLGEFTSALVKLRLYLVLEPDPARRTALQGKVYELELRAEEGARREQDRAARRRLEVQRQEELQRMGPERARLDALRGRWQVESSLYKVSRWSGKRELLSVPENRGGTEACSWADQEMVCQAERRAVFGKGNRIEFIPITTAYGYTPEKGYWLRARGQVSAGELSATGKGKLRDDGSWLWSIDRTVGAAGHGVWDTLTLSGERGSREEVPRGAVTGSWAISSTLTRLPDTGN